MNKASPFPQVVRKKHATMKHIDPDLIEICNDPYVGVRSSPKGKYDEMFSMLKPGQCLKCEPHESAPLATALRKWLLTGLLVIVPGVITAWVLHWIVSTLDQTLQILPEAWHPDRLLGVHVPGFAVVLTLLILLTVGAIASNFAGRKLVQWGDALVHRIPVVRSIYSSVKQVSDTLFSESGNAFRTAVLVQWPREGVWTVAFVTGAPSGEVAAYLRDEFVSVYVPTTPNPTGGYFVMVRKSDCVELDMSVDAALKYIVSMGVVAPPDPALASSPK